MSDQENQTMQMGFSFSIKKDPPLHKLRNYEQSNSQILLLKIWNTVSESFILLPTGNFITASKTYACKQKTEVKHIR